MSKGALLIANNNAEIDYIMQACFSAKRIRKHLKLPVSIITDTPELFETTYKKYKKLFDKIIAYNDKSIPSVRMYKDGGLYTKSLEFKNTNRSSAYDLTPYEETILLDTDLIIFNDSLLKCFSYSNDILMYKRAIDVSPFRKYNEFERISDAGVDFYWATCVYFKKSANANVFFELTKHIKENWNHYRLIYGVSSVLFRNDYVFSIAAHMLNGFSSGSFVKEMPGLLVFSIDRDEVLELTDTHVKFLINKTSNSESNVLVTVRDTNLHIMNKYNLDRIIKNDC